MKIGCTPRTQPRSVAEAADAKGKRKGMASYPVVPSSCLGFIVSTGLSIISLHWPKVRMLYAVLTSAGGIPSGGRQGSTIPCSSETSLATGSCSKFFLKSRKERNSEWCNDNNTDSPSCQAASLVAETHLVPGNATVAPVILSVHIALAP